MHILGFNKTTLLDYPGHIASTVFLSACNYRCPFCHNASLVIPPFHSKEIPYNTVLTYLNQKKHILEGVCITGGEPTLHANLPDFMRTIKSMGLKIKLDTNGTNPSLIHRLIQDDLIDYIAMDIKNSKSKYYISTGLSTYNTNLVEESVTLLQSGTLPYEFRTTLVLEHHTLHDIHAIGEWLQGDSLYYLQNFRPSEHTITDGLHSLPESLLKKYCHELSHYLPKVSIRGMS